MSCYHVILSGPDKRALAPLSHALVVHLHTAALDGFRDAGVAWDETSRFHRAVLVARKGDLVDAVAGFELPEGIDLDVEKGTPITDLDAEDAAIAAAKAKEAAAAEEAAKVEAAALAAIEEKAAKKKAAIAAAVERLALKSVADHELSVKRAGILAALEAAGITGAEAEALADRKLGIVVEPAVVEPDVDDAPPPMTPASFGAVDPVSAALAQPLSAGEPGALHVEAAVDAGVQPSAEERAEVDAAAAAGATGASELS